MAGPTTSGEKPSKSSMLGLLVFAAAIHTMDAFMRLPGGKVNFYIWTMFFVLYAVLAVMGSSRLGTWKGPAIASGLAAFVIPILYTYVARSSIVLGMLMLLMPAWIFYLLIFHGEYYPWTSWLYIMFWIIFLAFSYMPQIQNYASTQGYELPTISPGIVVRYTGTALMQGFQNAKQSVQSMYSTVSREVVVSYKAAKGDYYTGSVDQSAEKITGVYVDGLKPVQQEFFEGRPVTIRGQIRAATVAQPLNIHLTCIAEPGNIAAKSIEPEKDITVVTAVGSITKPVSCVFEGLTAKYYTTKLTVDFNFATRAYQRVYFMNEERLQEYLILGKDPLEGYTEKMPTTQHSPGPIMIGMTESFPTQPVGITQGKNGPIVGITVDNFWGGTLKEVKDLVIYLPKGLDVKDINGVYPLKISCSDLRTEESVGCDDNLESIYRMPPAEMQMLSQTTVKTYEAHTFVSDSAKLISDPKTIKVTVDYDYTYTQELGISVKSRPTTTSPATLPSILTITS